MPAQQESAAPTKEKLSQMLEEDDIDAFIHAKCSTHLQNSLKTLDALFERGAILDDEYYKKKALIQEQIQRQQEEMRMKLYQKKKELREKQYYEDAASQQRALQQNLVANKINDNAKHILHGTGVQRPDLSNSAPPANRDTAPEARQLSKSDRTQTYDEIFSAAGGKSKHSNFGTIKMDPRSSDFDADAYKRLMIENYEKQNQENTIRLRIKKLGDPSSSEFNPGEYKRLMQEKYEIEFEREQLKRKLVAAKPPDK